MIDTIGIFIGAVFLLVVAGISAVPIFKLWNESGEQDKEKQRLDREWDDLIFKLGREQENRKRHGGRRDLWWLDCNDVYGGVHTKYLHIERNHENGIGI